MASIYSQNEDVEVISEGDTYPRPRFACPASYLEAFDTALRADDRFDRILKYMFDYTASAYYEREYITQTDENRDLYMQIEKIFCDKNDAGVNIIEYKNLASDMEYDGETAEERIYSILRLATARGSWSFLDNLSVPAAFGSDSVGIVFGESARHVPEDILKKNGTIIDIAAARLLKERGIDTGLLSSEAIDADSRVLSGIFERYRYEKENVYVPGKGIF